MIVVINVRTGFDWIGPPVTAECVQFKTQDFQKYATPEMKYSTVIINVPDFKINILQWY